MEIAGFILTNISFVYIFWKLRIQKSEIEDLKKFNEVVYELLINQSEEDSK